MTTPEMPLDLDALAALDAMLAAAPKKAPGPSGSAG